MNSMKCKINDANNIAAKLSELADETLENEIDKIFKMDEISNNDLDEKFHTSFSLYGASKRFSMLTVKEMRNNKFDQMSTKELEKIRDISFITLRLFTCFIYMRSELLESKLKQMLKKSTEDLTNLELINDLFLKKQSNQENKPLSQYIRNSISHGSFIFKGDSIEFSDRKDKFTLTFIEISRFCEVVLKFYYCLYNVFCLQNNLNSKNLTIH